MENKKKVVSKKNSMENSPPDGAPPRSQCLGPPSHHRLEEPGPDQAS